MLFKQVTAAARTLTLKNTYNSNATKYININLDECEVTPYEKIKTLNYIRKPLHLLRNFISIKLCNVKQQLPKHFLNILLVNLS